MLLITLGAVQAPRAKGTGFHLIWGRAKLTHRVQDIKEGDPLASTDRRGWELINSQVSPPSSAVTKGLLTPFLSVLLQGHGFLLSSLL